MGADYDQVVAALPRLSPEERARVAQRLEMLQSVSPGRSLADATGAFQAAGVADEASGELLAVIADVSLRMSGERVSPAALRRARQFQSLAAKAGALRRLLEAQAPTRPARRALLALGVELLYRDLARAGFSVSARTLMACAHQVPAALDKAFPGYARAGLLGMVVGRASARTGESHGGSEEASV